MKLPEIKVGNKVITFKHTVDRAIRLKKEIGKNPLSAILDMYSNINTENKTVTDLSAFDLDEELMFATLYHASQYLPEQRMSKEEFNDVIQEFLDEEVVTETDEEIITEYRSIFTDILPIFIEIATQCGYIPRQKTVVKKGEAEGKN